MAGLAESVAQIKVAALGRPLTLADVIRQVLGMAARYAYRTLTSLIGCSPAKRKYSLIMRVYYRRAIVSYLTEYNRSKK
jgi:hypothetical protein